MKAQRKNSQRLYLQESNSRWKWMAAATAVSAAVTASEAVAATITLTNNHINADGNHLNADLTGDGHPDLTITGAAFYNNHLPFTPQKSYAAVMLNGIQASAYFNGFPYFRLKLGSQFLNGTTNFSQSLTGSIPISFTDLRINGGARTTGSLQVRVFGTEIQLDSLTYKGNSVPDQGSSLALLAMGAGGVLALRRLRAA